MHENTFKQIDNVFRRSMGSESDYVEQASWMLFLRYIDAMEEQNRSRAILNGEEYTPVLADGYRWSDWAFKTDAEGKALSSGCWRWLVWGDSNTSQTSGPIPCD